MPTVPRLPRSRVPERMDDPAIEPGAHALALRGLARLNAWSASHRLLWPAFLHAARTARDSGRRAVVMDVATGSADGPVRLATMAARRGLPVELVLCDESATALDSALARAGDAGVTASAHRCNVLKEPLPRTADLVTCSLFMHHLDRDDAVQALSAMAAAADRSLAIADLDRSRAGLGLAWLGARVLSRSPVVHFDAPASVRAAHSPDEILSMARAAGMDGVRVATRFPFRWVLRWDRP
jgi:hypothetical protein